MSEEQEQYTGQDDQLLPGIDDNVESASVSSDQPAPPVDEIRSVYMRKKFGSLFPGEIGGFQKHIADEFIAKGFALPLDDAGQPIFPPEQVAELPNIPLSNIIEPDNTGVNGGNVDGAGGDGSTRRSRRKRNEQSAPANTTVTTLSDDQLKLFLADGLDRDQAASLYNAGLKTPDDVAKALADGRDLDAEVAGIGPVTFAQLKSLYGE